MTALKLSHVNKAFGAVQAVKDLSFEVQEGAIHGLLGPNGAGKTTTIRMIMQIIIQDSGAIDLFGKPMNTAMLDQIGYLPEERGLYRKMKVIEELQFLGELKGLRAREAKKKSLDWLERFDMTGAMNKKVEELSKGNQQKIQFIATIMHQPRLMILDEPFSGLDPLNAELMKNTILEMRDAGCCIIFSTHLQEWRIVEQGLSAEFAKTFARHVEIETYRVSAGSKAAKEEGGTYMLTFGLVMFLYICVLTYGASITQAVLEEKTSRVVELIISSVRPFQLMLGKILGVGSVGLTQFIIWSLVAGLVSAYAGTIASWFDSTSAPALPVISPAVLVCFGLYFVLGYFLYATMYAAVGAIVNSQEEAQSMQFPVTMILIVPILLVNFVINNPNASSSVAMSFVPFFLPILMFARVATDMPSFNELMLSFAVMLLSIYLMTMVVGKIFRVGILMYGKRPTLPEVWRWVRY